VAQLPAESLGAVRSHIAPVPREHVLRGDVVRRPSTSGPKGLTFCGAQERYTRAKHSSIAVTRAPDFAFSTTRQIGCFLASTLTCDPYMVWRTIGTLGKRSLICSAAFRPFSSGIAQSRTTRSGLSSMAFLTASRPFTASPHTSQSGCDSSVARTRRNTDSWSSAMRMRFVNRKTTCQKEVMSIRPQIANSAAVSNREISTSPA